jgi:hypothetical protein
MLFSRSVGGGAMVSWWWLFEVLLVEVVYVVADEGLLGGFLSRWEWVWCMCCWAVFQFKGIRFLICDFG